MPNSLESSYSYAFFLNRAFRALRWFILLGASSFTLLPPRAARGNSVTSHSDYSSIVEYDVPSDCRNQQASQSIIPFIQQDSFIQQDWQEESAATDHTVALAEISNLYLDNYGDGRYGNGMTLSSDGKTIYIVNANGLIIIDVSNKFTPSVKSTFSTGMTMFEIVLLDKHWACITNTFKGLVIVNITDPIEPTLKATLPFPEKEIPYFLDVSIDGNTVYVVTHASNFFVVDVQEREKPKILASIPLGGLRLKRSLGGRYVYTVNGETLFKVIDVLYPENPTVVGSLNLVDGARRVALTTGDDMVVVSQYNQIRTVNVHNPNAPFELPNPLPIILQRMKLSFEEKLGYGASETGAYVVDLQAPRHLRLVGKLNRRDEPSDAIALSPDGKELYMSVHSGLSIARIIKEPFLPALLTKKARIPTMPLDGSADDLLLIHNERIAYLALGQPSNLLSGFMIIDISNPGVPKLIRKYSPPNVSFDHWVLSNNGLLYTVDHRWLKFRIVDVRTPTQPVMRGSYDISQQGKVYFIPHRDIVYILHGGSESKEVIILNVKDPDSPTKIGDYSPETEIHSIEPSADGQYIFIANKRGLEIANITGTNVTDPQIISHYTSAGEANILRLSPDNQMLYARFTTTMSIQIIDVTNPQNMRYVTKIDSSGTGTFSALGEIRLTPDGKYAYIGLVYGVGLYDVSDLHLKRPQMKAYITLPGSVKLAIPMTNYPYLLVAARLNGFHSILVEDPAPLVALLHPSNEQQVIKVNEEFERQFIIYHGRTLQEASGGGFTLTALQMNRANQPKALPSWLTFSAPHSSSDTFPPTSSRPQFGGTPARIPEPLVIEISAKSHDGILLMRQRMLFEVQSSLTLTVNSTALKIAGPAHVLSMNITLSDREAGAFMPHQKGSVAGSFDFQKGQFSASGSIPDLNAMLAELRFSTKISGNHTAVVDLKDGINNPLTQQILLEIFSQNRAPEAMKPMIIGSATTSQYYVFHITNFFEDPDGDPLYYSYTVEGNRGEHLSWLNLDSGTGVFSGRPPVTEFGTIKLTITVTDGYKSVHTPTKLKVDLSMPDLVDKLLTYGGPAISVLFLIYGARKCRKPIERRVQAGCCGYHVNKALSFFHISDKKWNQKEVGKENENNLEELGQILDRLDELQIIVAYKKRKGGLKLQDHHRKQKKIRSQIEDRYQELLAIQSLDSRIEPLLKDVEAHLKRIDSSELVQRDDSKIEEDPRTPLLQDQDDVGLNLISYSNV